MNDQIVRVEDENKLIAERRAKLDSLRGDGFSFPNDFRRTAMAGELQVTFGDETKEALAERDESFSVAGRLIRNRGAFLLIQDGSDTIQLYIDRKGLSDDVLASIKSWDLGDIVGASGVLCKSGKGDLYINMAEARLLTKALSCSTLCKKRLRSSSAIRPFCAAKPILPREWRDPRRCLHPRQPTANDGQAD